MEERWNDIDRVKLKDSERNLSQCYFMHHRTIWIAVVSIPGLPCEKPATNRLSSGTASRLGLHCFNGLHH
jgi:hypothetical protein